MSKSSKNIIEKPKFSVGEQVLPAFETEEWDIAKIIDIKWYNEVGWAYRVETKNTYLDPNDSWFWEKQLIKKIRKHI